MTTDIDTLVSHTPGPWSIGPMHRSVFPVADGEVVKANANGGFAVCEVFGEAERRANARLIAAAPELLDGILGLLNYGIVEDDARLSYLTVQIDRDAIERARTAMCRARDLCG